MDIIEIGFIPVVCPYCGGDDIAPIPYSKCLFRKVGKEQKSAEVFFDQRKMQAGVVCLKCMKSLSIDDFRKIQEKWESMQKSG